MPYNNDDELRLQSYLWVRKAVGLIGFLLPIVLVAGDCISIHTFCIRPSISDYYYTIMGNLFVGALCAISLFLFTYKGYNEPIVKRLNARISIRFLSDNALTNIAAIAALGVAFFPCNGNDRNPLLQMLICPCIIPVIHYLSAAIFFIALASMSIWSFTQSNNPGKVRKGSQKYKRNQIYKLCGIAIFVSIATIGLLGAIKAIRSNNPSASSGICSHEAKNACDTITVMAGADSCRLYNCYYKNLKAELLNKPDETEDYFTFLFETIALFAFGFSWFVKGETLWKDK